MNDGDTITKRLRIRQNVSGEENRLALVFQLFHQVANFTTAHGIEA